MYSIRVDSPHERLAIEFSDSLNTSEALRSVSQGFALAEAGHLTDIVCDLTRVRRGPSNLFVVAASLASHHGDGMRIALVVTEEQVRWVQRLVRFSGIRQGIHAFLETAQAEAWLSMPARRQHAVLSTTGERHLREMTRTPAANDGGPGSRRQGVA
jgi:hypothetical protein